MEEPYFEEDDDDHTLGGESNENMRPMNELEGSPKFAGVTAEEEGLSNMDSLARDAHESEDEEVLASMEMERSPKKKKISSSKSKSWGKSNKSAKSSSAEEAEIPDDEPLVLTFDRPLLLSPCSFLSRLTRFTWLAETLEEMGRREVLTPREDNTS